MNVGEEKDMKNVPEKKEMVNTSKVNDIVNAAVAKVLSHSSVALWYAFNNLFCIYKVMFCHLWNGLTIMIQSV